MANTRPAGWKITMGLCGIALLAAFIAPRLRAPEPPPTEMQAEMDMCLRLGPYECCYVSDEPEK